MKPHHILRPLFTYYMVALLLFLANNAEAQAARASRISQLARKPEEAPAFEAIPVPWSPLEQVKRMLRLNAQVVPKINREVTGKIQEVPDPLSLEALSDSEGTCELTTWCEPKFLSRYLEKGTTFDSSRSVSRLIQMCEREVSAQRIQISNVARFYLMSLEQRWACAPLETLERLARAISEILERRADSAEEYLLSLEYLQEIETAASAPDSDSKRRIIPTSNEHVEAKIHEARLKVADPLDASVVGVKEISALKSKREDFNFYCELELQDSKIEVMIRRGESPSNKIDELKEKASFGVLTEKKQNTKIREMDGYALYRIARLYYLNGEVDKAVSALKEIFIKEYILSYDQILFMFDVFKSKNMYPEVAKLLSYAVSKNPRDAWWSREIIYFHLKIRQFDTALGMAVMRMDQVDKKYHILDAYLDAFAIAKNADEMIKTVEGILENKDLDEEMVLYVKTMLLIRLERITDNQKASKYAIALKEELIWTYGWEFEKMLDLIHPEDVKRRYHQSPSEGGFSTMEKEVIGGMIVSFLIAGAAFLSAKRKKTYKKTLDVPSIINKRKRLLEAKKARDQYKASTPQAAHDRPKAVSPAENAAYYTSAYEASNAAAGQAIPRNPLHTRAAPVVEAAATSAPVAAPIPEVPLVLNWDLPGIPNYDAANVQDALLFTRVTSIRGKPPLVPTFMYVIDDIRQDKNGDVENLVKNVKKSCDLFTKTLMWKIADTEKDGKELLYKLKVKGGGDLRLFGRPMYIYGEDDNLRAVLWIFDEIRTHKQDELETHNMVGVGVLINDDELDAPIRPAQRAQLGPA